MANLFKASGGVIGTQYLTASWATPNGLFPTTDRNDGTAYSWSSSTSTVTLPASGLADGYLIVAAFEHETSQNDRHNPQGKIIQASGTGTFVGGPTGGYCRDNSENVAYVRTWAFVDNPSASATFTFQWKRDNEDANPTDGTNRSEFQVIPLYYSDFGAYTSTSAGLYGGTTPNVVTGFTGTDGTNITIASNVVSVTGDNKRYLVLGSQFFEGFATRTQRWHGLDIDGVQEDAAKAYSYYREANNDESGDLFTWLLETATATVTIEQTSYRGDGILDDEGGADVDGSTPAVGDHALVILELNDPAEVFLSRDNTVSANIATAGPTDLQVNTVTDFNDTDSFIDLVDTSINAVQTADYLFGANISAAQGTVAATQRWTAFVELTVNGTEVSDSFAGDYMRNNQGSIDTFGWSANLLGFQALTAGDDVGVSVTELSGTEGGGGDITSPAGWTGFWGVNLDTLEAGASPIAADETLTFSDSATLEANGKLSASETLLFSDLATIEGSGELAAAETITFSDTADLSGIGVLSTTQTISFSDVASISALGTLAASETLSFTSVSDLNGTGDLTSSQTIVFSDAVTISALGDLSTSQTITFSDSATITGGSALAASVTMTFSDAAALEGIGDLVAAETVTFSSTGTLVAPSGSIAASETVTFSDSVLIQWTLTDFNVNYAGLNVNSPFFGDVTYIDLVSGDKCHFETLTDPDQHLMTMAGDGEFNINPAILSQNQTFDFQIVDSSDGTYGSIGTITVEPAVSGALTASETLAFSATGTTVAIGTDKAANLSRMSLHGGMIKWARNFTQTTKAANLSRMSLHGGMIRWTRDFAKELGSISASETLSFSDTVNLEGGGLLQAGETLLFSDSANLINGAAGFDQFGFRWGDDDNTESLYTFLEAQDVDLTQASNESVILRYLLNTTGDTLPTQFKLQVKRSAGPASEWRDVPLE